MSFSWARAGVVVKGRWVCLGGFVLRCEAWKFAQMKGVWRGHDWNVSRETSAADCLRILDVFSRILEWPGCKGEDGGKSSGVYKDSLQVARSGQELTSPTRCTRHKIYTLSHVNDTDSEHYKEKRILHIPCTIVTLSTRYNSKKPNRPQLLAPRSYPLQHNVLVAAPFGCSH